MYLNEKVSDKITKSTIFEAKIKDLAKKIENCAIFFYLTSCQSWTLCYRSILFIYHELEGTVRKGCLVRAEDDCVPHHDVVLAGGPAHARGRVLLQAFEITHKSTSGCCWHDGDVRVEGELKEYQITLQKFLILWDETKETLFRMYNKAINAFPNSIEIFFCF